MDAPSVANPAPSAADEEVVLRLGDILARLPAEALKPGPHDRMRAIRFSVDELAEQISRGRVSIPLTRLATACPEIFAAPETLPAGEEIPLPLQKLLDQIGLSTARTSYNGIPKAQKDRARVQARTILQAAGVSRPEPVKLSVPPPQPELQPDRVAKTLSAAKKFLGLFGRQNESSPVVSASAEPPKEAPASVSSAKPGEPAREADPKSEPAAGAPQAVPEGFISLRVAPIFRLLGNDVLRPGPLPPPDARVLLPLELIDPHLASGHVEVPLEELIEGLPENLRSNLHPVPGTHVWLPLDEIFQNLPASHLYHMPPLNHAAAENPPEGVAPEKSEPAEIAETRAEINPEPTAREIAPETPVKAESEPEPEPVPEVPPKTEAQPEPFAAAAEPAPESPAPMPEPAPAATARAPWMRGFVVPPPRLFSSGQPVPHPEAVPTNELSVAKTPEAKQTADFLATQPGIFAAAAFVEGAIFASADFPRKPDLDTLRDVVGAFAESARESSRRLGWERVLTLACEKFFVTAAIRESHFVVALHHDRALPPVAHQALIGAAEDLGKTKNG